MIRIILIAALVGNALALSISVQGADGVPLPEAATTNSSMSLTLEEKPGPNGIWVDDSVGAGFRPGLEQAGLSLGAAFATHLFSAPSRHDLALSRIQYGWMLGHVVGRPQWYRGNWELIQEIFGGMQYNPSSRYLFGETTVLRYNFATGTRWIPFLDGGAGASATDIGLPDLGSIFEFNLQAGLGVNYFWCKNSALTFQYRFMHLSNANTTSHNRGVNESVFYAGVSWFF